MTRALIALLVLCVFFSVPALLALDQGEMGNWKISLCIIALGVVAVRRIVRFSNSDRFLRWLLGRHFSEGMGEE